MRLWERVPVLMMDLPEWSHWVTLQAVRAGLAAVTWWWTFRRTPDLDDVPNRTIYRLGLWVVWLNAIDWWLRWMGVLHG